MLLTAFIILMASTTIIILKLKDTDGQEWAPNWLKVCRELST